MIWVKMFEISTQHSAMEGSEVGECTDLNTFKNRRGIREGLHGSQVGKGTRVIIGKKMSYINIQPKEQ